MDAWTLLQLADSALPTGGFAHSGGLEAALQLGHVDGPEGVARFLEESLSQASALAVPFVRAALAEPSALATLDARLDAAIPGHVANRASRAQGRAFLRATGPFVAPVAALEAAVRAGGLAGHLPPVFGAVLAALGAGEDETARLFLFHQARGVASAAVRLGLCGPSEAQALLARVAPLAEAALARSAGVGPDDAAASSPLLDLFQSHQDRLYSRLFQS